MLVILPSDYIDDTAQGKSRGHLSFHVGHGDDKYEVSVRGKRASLCKLRIEVVDGVTWTSYEIPIGQGPIDFAMSDELVKRARAELRARGK